jgi:uncharacterized protein (DUF1330 family)
LSSYFIALIDIHDPDEYEKYLTGYDEVFKKFDGKVIAVDDHPRILEGAWPAGRTVLIIFPSDQALRNWYDSKEYRAIAKHRRNASVGSIAIITGQDD